MPGDRYLSVMVVNNDHYINEVLHEPGDHELTVDRFDTDYVLVAARILVDPDDPADLAAVHALQDQIGADAPASARPFVMPDYDTASLDTTRDALLTLARGMHGVRPRLRPQGRRRPGPAPARHGRRAGAGCPSRRRSTSTSIPASRSASTRSPSRDVPVDGFWSISVYNADGLLRAQRPQRLQRQQHHRHTRTPTARSPSTSAAAATTDRTACRSWTAGTTPSACTGRDPRSSTAPGPSPLPNPHSQDCRSRAQTSAGQHASSDRTTWRARRRARCRTPSRSRVP